MRNSLRCYRIKLIHAVPISLIVIKLLISSMSAAAFYHCSKRARMLKSAVTCILLATFSASALPIVDYSGDSQSTIFGGDDHVDEQHSAPDSTDPKYYLIVGVTLCLVVFAFLGGWLTNYIIHTLRTNRKQQRRQTDGSRSPVDSPSIEGGDSTRSNEESTIIPTTDVCSISEHEGESQTFSTPMKDSNASLIVSCGPGRKLYNFERFISTQNGERRKLSLSEFTDSLSRIGDYYKQKPSFRVKDSSMLSTLSKESASSGPQTRVHHSSPICKATLSSPTLQRLLSDRSMVPSLARLIKMDSDVPKNGHPHREAPTHDLSNNTTV